MKHIFLLLAYCLTLNVQAQSDLPLSLHTQSSSELSLSADELRTDLTERGMFTLALPDGHGAELEYDFAARAVQPMHPKLAARYPQIQNVVGTTEDGSFVVLTLHDEKVFGVVKIKGQPERSIEPQADGRQLLRTESFDPAAACGMEEPPTDIRPGDPSAQQHDSEAIGLRSGGFPAAGRADTLYTYRMAFALAAVVYVQNGYTQVSEGLALISNHVAAANVIFQRDFGVRFELIADNDQLIFTDPATDPFDEFPTAVDANNFVHDNHDYLMDPDGPIGPDNFDIGHMVGWVSTGRGSYQAPCSQGARGRGGSDNWNAQIRHEFGHQINSVHTYQRVNDAVDHPDGNRITELTDYNMGWYGDHFHSDNYIFAHQHIVEGTGRSCGTQTVQNRTAPVMVNSATNGTYIPVGTPFVLENTSTTDPDPGANLEYTWQHLGGGDFGAYDERNVTPENRLIWSPRPFAAANTVRYVPSLSSLMSGIDDPNSVLPTVTRTLTYRFVAIDNETPVGGVNFREETLNVHDTGAPFTVTGPDTDVNATGGQPLAVTWNVAGTDAAPISAATVDIYLTQDNGATWTAIATNETNDGNTNVTLPATATTNGAKTARLLVRGTGRAFFNLSPANFEIVPTGTSEFRVRSDSRLLTQCGTSTTVTGTLSTLERGTFSGNISLTATGLPTGATISFSPATATVGQTVNYTVDLTNATAGPLAAVELTGTASGFTHFDTVFVATPREAVTPTQMGSLARSYHFPELDTEHPAFTLEYWIRPSRVESQFSRLQWGSFNAGFSGSSTAGFGHFSVWIDGGGSMQSDLIAKDEWVHMAIVYDFPSVKLYLNGDLNQEFTATQPIKNWAQGLRLGMPDHWYTVLYGYFDQVRVWSEARTGEEIRQHLHLPIGADAVCNEGLEINLQYSTGSTDIDRAGKQVIVRSSGGVENFPASDGPISSGTAHRQTVMTTGAVAFDNSLDINFGAAPNGEISVTRLDGTPHGTMPSNEPMMANYWVIHNYGTTQSGLDATLTFTEAGFVTAAQTNPANYHLYKRGSTDRAGWEDPIAATSVDVATGAVTFSGIDGFRQFAVVRSNMAILPVELLDFTARSVDATTVRLDWETALEENNAGFTLERSTDGRSFTDLTWVDGKNQAATYRFDDRDLPTEASVLYYRLRQRDHDGSETQSRTVSVSLAAPATLWSVAPNPVSAEGTLDATTTNPVHFELLGTDGRQYARFAPGTTRLVLPDLPAGVYVLRNLLDGTVVRLVIRS